jgi:hypothetical protein
MRFWIRRSFSDTFAGNAAAPGVQVGDEIVHRGPDIVGL